MVVNENNPKIWASLIAPNPEDVSYWVDLNADPHGNIIKFYDENDEKWYNLTSPTSDYAVYPYIGPNGNWFIENRDSGISATGEIPDATINGYLISENPVLTKHDIGLGNVANLAPEDYPVPDEVYTLIGNKVDNTRTINGYPLSSNITITKDDLGLGSVENIAPADMPISTAVNTALNSKVNTSRNLSAGYGLTGGGDLTADRTFNVSSANDGITVNPDNIQLNVVDSLVSTSTTQPLSANQGKTLNESKVPNTRTVNGYPLSANVTLTKTDVGLGNVSNLAPADLPVSTATQTALNSKVSASRQVIAGTGLTGGGSLTGDVTLNVASGNDGITASADAITLNTVNNLTSTSVTQPLSAAQGKALQDGKINNNGTNSNIDVLHFNPTTLTALSNIGDVRFSDESKTLEVKVSDTVSIQLGQETQTRVKNSAGVQINNGQLVYVDSASGANPLAKLATTADPDIAQRTFGMATEDIAINGFGAITTEGLVRDVNTSAFAEGAMLWLSTNGSVTTTEPVAPTPKISVGMVLRSNANNGVIYVKIRAIARNSKLSDVYAPTLANGNVLRWNSATSRFEVWDTITTLANKVDVVAGKGLSTNDYTTTEKNKLAGIAENANNYVHPATHSADILTNGTTNKVYTATEQTKLAGIATGAEVNVQSDWNAVSGDALILNKPTTINGYGITDAYTKTEVDTKLSSVYKYKGIVPTSVDLPSTGMVLGDVWNVTDTNINYAWDGSTWDPLGGVVGADVSLATPTTNGLLSATDFIKLSGIEANANYYVHPTTHSADIIVDGTTNKVYTATEKTKLAGIAAGAEVNVNPDWNAVSGDAQILNKPTTISGYGITDAYTKTQVDTALSGKEPTITAGTTTQYWRGDKSWQTLNKAAVGLSNVENTALSTWAGSTNVTTLGTVTNGTWSGATIAVAKGGTGLTALGTANQLLRVNAGATALEYFTPTWTSNTGTVTSVSMTVPTGLTVTGSPVTTAGTFALSFTSGYSIPTTAKQTNWDTAYGWGNHAGLYQPLDSDLTSIAGLAGTSGLLKKTAANTWSLDTSTYLTAITKAQVEGVLTGTITSHNHTGVYEPLITKSTGYAKYNGSAWSFVDETYSLSNHTHSYLPLSGGQLTGQLSLLQGASGGISFPDNSFGGGGDSASIRLLNPVGGESTEMTFTMTNDADDIINFSVPSIDGVKINRYTVWNAGNFTNLTQLTTRNFIDLQNKPTTLSGYGITDSIARDDRGVGNIIANNINYSVYGFGYSSDGFPTNGSFISFGGLNNRYVTQIQGSYGGAGMYYRTRNDDNGTWNSWHTILDDVNAYTKTLADNTFLKLAGGTLTGSVFLPLDKPALRFGNARGWDSAIAHDTASYEVEAFMSKNAGSKYRFKVGFDPTGFTSGSFVNMTDADLEIGAGYCKINNNTVWHAGNFNPGNYQPVDADLTAIAALAGTSGFLKKTAADTWSLDTNTYLTGNQTITLSGAVSGSGTTAITTSYAGTVPTTKGGTGLTSIGTAGQVLRVNAGATGLEWGTIAAGLTLSGTQYGVVYAATSSTIASTAAGTAGQYLKSNGTSAPTWETFRDKGVNTVTTLASLPITKRLVTATVAAATTLSLASALEIGDELHVIVYNSSASAITQTLPNSGSYISLSGTSISIPAGGRVEINILCYATTSYLIRAL